MLRARVLALAALAAAASLAPPARASFGEPVELARGPVGFDLAAAADAGGFTTLLSSSGNHGPRLYERPAGGPWSAAAALPGDPKGVAGPVVDAAGRGALGIAWRVDTPRHYTGIAVAMRDPGGTLGQSVQVAGPEAGGVRHPALAIDPAGDAVLAYQVGTNATHLNRGGGIAIAGRPVGGRFSEPTVVDRAVWSAPAVALAPDGTGIVAWAHDRRVYAVSVDPDGRTGKVKRIASPGSVVSLVAAAGEGGAATVAWIGHHLVGRGRTARTRRDVRAMGRRPGHAFAAVDTVASTTDYVRSVDIAADDDGQVTLAWSREHFGEDRSIGTNGITSAVLAATAQAGERFPAPRTVAARGGRYRSPPAVTAAGGRVALTWGFQADRHDFGVEAAVGRPRALGSPQTIVRVPDQPSYGGLPPSVVTLGPTGVATVVYVASAGKPPAVPVDRLLAADGS
ncbi:MAG: hypothetical protein ACXVVU_20545 [Solirubrobacteraceae bacterium]